MRKKLLHNKIFAPGFCFIESNWLNTRKHAPGANPVAGASSLVCISLKSHVRTNEISKLFQDQTNLAGMIPTPFFSVCQMLKHFYSEKLLFLRLCFMMAPKCEGKCYNTETEIPTFVTTCMHLCNMHLTSVIAVSSLNSFIKKSVITVNMVSLHELFIKLFLLDWLTWLAWPFLKLQHF